MNGEELAKMVKYLFNISGTQFAKDVYKREYDGYAEEKFHKMQNRTLWWLAELDSAHLQNLAEAVNNS